MPIEREPSRTPFFVQLLLVACVVSCGASMSKMAGAPSPMSAMRDGAPSAMAMSKTAAEESAKPVATWKRSTLGANTTRLMVGDTESLPLRGVQAQVRVDGFRARVVLDYLFENDRPGALEGNFQIRLPNEASPYFFAFGELASQQPQLAVAPELYAATETRSMGVEPEQIMTSRARSWTQPKEARIVPKEKAALAYTNTVRQRVDPALMEWSGAGVFSARVFPLQPHKLYRIVIGYDANLTSAGEDLEYQFDVPAGTDQRAVDVTVATVAGSKLELSPAATPTLEGTRLFARYDRPTAPTITLRLKGAQSVLLNGKDSSSAPYFAARIAPRLPATAAAQGVDEAVFVVDTSLSSNPDRFNIWLKLLKATLDNNRPTLQRFAVLFFNVETHWWRPAFVANTPQNVEEMLDYAGKLTLEGATDLGAALSEATRPQWQSTTAHKGDLFLLSDGAPTWGEGDPQLLGKLLRDRAGALFAYSTGIEGTETATLELLARESGGAVFSVAGEAEIETASRAHRSRPLRLVGIEVPGASDVLIAGRPKFLFPGQRLTLAGRGVVAAGAEVTLKLEREGTALTVRTRLAMSAESELAPRTYGQIAVVQLEEIGDSTEAIAKAYATRFRVVGRTCSLLMLDSERDYARFNIQSEADREVVQQQPAATAIERALAALGSALGDPKASFMGWMQRLQHTPGIAFRMSPEFAQALQKMPTASFAVESRPLQCKILQRALVPPAFTTSLAKRAVDYESATAESARRLKQAGPADALKALSTLVEQNPGDSVLARDVGYSALEWGLADHAYYLFRRVANARPYEPQNYRAMAQALASVKKADLALALFEVALATQFDSRFGEFRHILSVDYLRFLRRVAAGELRTSVPEFAGNRLAALTRQVDIKAAELMVMITWNTDGTDVDLHVTEPSGEECMYSHRQTASGGELTQDVTQGYGPEMYVLPRTKSGTYLVRAHYFASDRSRASARTKVYATIFENWGMPNERVTERVIALEVGKEWHTLASIAKTGTTLQIAQ